MCPDRVEFNRPLASLTTYGLGGQAWAVARPDTVDQLRRLMAWAAARHWPVFVLGGGSNVLFSDQGFQGLIIRLGRGFQRLEALGADSGRVVVSVGAAVKTPLLVARCREWGWAGLEFLAGIPGVVGGALAMNAGASGGEIVDAVSSVEVMWADGRVRRLARTDLKPDYRGLGLPDDAVILGAVFDLTPDDPPAIKARIRDIMVRRSQGQPRGVKSAGCVFKNPSGESAGRLIDRAGLKGAAEGGAFVSPKHANFIVHRGRASSADVTRLIRRVKDEVARRHGCELETEIKIIDPTGKRMEP